MLRKAAILWPLNIQSGGKKSSIQRVLFFLLCFPVPRHLPLGWSCLNVKMKYLRVLWRKGMWLTAECVECACWGLLQNSAVSLFQFSSVAQSCLTLCDPMDCSIPGFLVHHQLLELAQTHVHWAGDAIQPSHPLSYSPPPAFNLSQHQSLFQWVSSSHQVAKVLEFQLQHQSFQRIVRTDFL